MLSKNEISNIQAKMIETMVDDKGYNELFVRTLLIRYDWKAHKAENKYLEIDWPMGD